MEINNPFRLKQLNTKLDVKTENNQFNRAKLKMNINKSIKLIWNEEPISYNSKILPFKNKRPLLLINNYNSNKNTKLKNNDNLDNTMNKKNKRSIFEDNYFIDKFKQEKIKYSFPINKANINTNHNFYLNNIYLGFESAKTDAIKTPLINNLKLMDNDLTKIPNVEDKNIYNKLNICFENYLDNINDKAINEYLKHQKKLLLNSTINNTKISKKPIYRNINNDNNDSLSKIIRIEPLTNINNNNNFKAKLNCSYTQDNILKIYQDKKIKLPTLSLNPLTNTNKNKISEIGFSSTEINNSSLLTDRHKSENPKDSRNKSKKI